MYVHPPPAQPFAQPSSVPSPPPLSFPTLGKMVPTTPWGMVTK